MSTTTKQVAEYTTEAGKVIDDVGLLLESVVHVYAVELPWRQRVRLACAAMFP